MIRLFAISMTLLFLTSCGSVPMKGDSYASDLDALESGVKRKLPARHLPNGKLYCYEASKNVGALKDCAGDLEDHVYNREGDVQDAIDFVHYTVARLKVARNQCGFWGRLFKPQKCTMEK